MEYESLVENGKIAVKYMRNGIDHLSAYIRTTIQANPDAFYWFKLPDNYKIPSFKECVVGTADSISSIHPNYWAVAILSVFCFFVLYIKFRYPFWNQVAALHTYDWHRRYLYSDKPYMIRLLPNKTRYYEPKTIETGYFRQLPNEKIQELVTLLQNYYIPSDRMFSSFQVADFAAYFSGHFHPPIVSIFNEIVQETGSIAEVENSADIKHQILQNTRKNIKGFLTSRPVTISIMQNKISAYFADFLCVQREVATPLHLRKLFSTHEYNQRTLHPEVNVTLFKKEVDLCEGLVPLVEYNVHTFYLPPKIRTQQIPQNFQLVRLQREYVHHLYDFIDNIANENTDLSILADIGALITLLRTNQLFAYALRGPEEGVTTILSDEIQKRQRKQPPSKIKLDTVYALYFFRNEQVKYDDLSGADTVHSIASFCNTNNNELYFTGFLLALRECTKDMGGNVKMLMMDDIGHLQGLLRRWMTGNTSAFTTRCAYYVCNYIVPKSPMDPSKCFLLL